MCPRTISLSEAQRRRAYNMGADVETTDNPTDWIDEWEPAPSTVPLSIVEEKTEQYVSVEDIRGTWKGNVTRFDTGRLRRVLKWLLDGEFEKEHEHPPHLMEVDGTYYVDADGNHRVIAFKYVGIDQIYAEVTRYERE